VGGLAVFLRLGNHKRLVCGFCAQLESSEPIERGRSIVQARRPRSLQKDCVRRKIIIKVKGGGVKRGVVNNQKAAGRILPPSRVQESSQEP
jgi:hypothetical protein